MEITEKELIEKYKHISDELLMQIICAITRRVNAEYEKKEKPG
jgi:hypothetical protein